MVHRRRAAVGVGLGDRLGARDQEGAVAPGQVAQVQPLLGGVDLRALVAAHDADVRARGLVDEERDTAPERCRDLHQARDRRRHAALLDLVHGSGRHAGPLGELRERPAAVGALGRDLRPEARDLALDLGQRRLRDVSVAIGCLRLAHAVNRIRGPAPPRDTAARAVTR
jgi:hypothetical protein